MWFKAVLVSKETTATRKSIHTFIFFFYQIQVGVTGSEWISWCVRTIDYMATTGRRTSFSPPPLSTYWLPWRRDSYYKVTPASQTKSKHSLFIHHHNNNVFLTLANYVTESIRTILPPPYTHYLTDKSQYNLMDELTSQAPLVPVEVPRLGQLWSVFFNHLGITIKVTWFFV